MNHAVVELAEKVVGGDRRKLIRKVLGGDSGQGWDIPTCWNLNANDLRTLFDHDPFADVCAKDQGLHSDEDVVASFRVGMDLRLIG